MVKLKDIMNQPEREQLTNPQYSQKERELFTALGYKDLLNQEPVVLYRMVALELFKQNKTGILVDSFRRCFAVYDNGQMPYRLRQEFDDLIVLKDQSVSYWDDPEKYPYFVGN
jgi:hypothetical protein